MATLNVHTLTIAMNDARRRWPIIWRYVILYCCCRGDIEECVCVGVQLCKKSEDDKDDLIDDVVTDSGKRRSLLGRAGSGSPTFCAQWASIVAWPTTFCAYKFFFS